MRVRVAKTYGESVPARGSSVEVRSRRVEAQRGAERRGVAASRRQGPAVEAPGVPQAVQLTQFSLLLHRLDDSLCESIVIIY